MKRLVPLVLALAACSKSPQHTPSSNAIADTSLRAPNGDSVPSGELGRAIRRGHAILAATADSLPEHVGSSLRCISCHLGDGRREGALPLTGVYARFPQYRSRTASVQRLEDRINDCFTRSLNGSPLKFDDPSMRDIVAYLAFISRGVAVGSAPRDSATGPISGDTVAGAQAYTRTCARCHGADGSGNAVYPPLWGDRSFNIGAGMARFRAAREFIQRNMPFDSPGTLNDADAANVAAYVTSRPRPDFAGKDKDWPKGGAPADAPYKTEGGKSPPP